MLCASPAVADSVTYTNAELTAMKEAGVARKKREYQSRKVLNSKSQCQTEAGKNGDNFMQNAHVIKEVLDESWGYELHGWGHGRFREANCQSFTPDGVNVKWRLHTVQYTWRKPKWSADDD